MSKIYFTLTGTNHYFGKEFLKKAVHANKIQALMLMITVMQIPEKEKNRKILKAVRVSTALLWLLTCVEDLMLMIRKNYN